MTKELHPAVREYLKKITSKGGKKTASLLTPEERKEKAKKAALTYWSKMSPEEKSERNIRLAKKRKNRKA